MVMYIDILPVQPAVLRVPYDLTNASAWLRYMANKKTLLIRPFDQHDIDVLLRRQRVRQEAMMHQALEEGAQHAGSALSPVGTPISPAQASLLSPNKHKRVRPEFLRERAGSMGSQRDRGNSVGSEFLGASPFRAASATNQKARLGKNFTVEVSLSFRVAFLLRRLADELSVEATHLALYFVPMGFRDWEERRGNVAPLNWVDHSHISIAECLKTYRISNKANTKYCVFYRILPFSLVTGDMKDSRESHKLADFLITDARVRKWRRMYLDHLKTLPAVLVRSGAATPRTGTSTPARSRSNSEAGTAGVRVVWPAFSATDCDPLEENYVSLCLPRATRLGDCTDALRGAIGIPENVRALDAMKQFTDPADGNATIAANAIRETPGLTKTLAAGESGVCSDNLAVDAHGAVQPAFPLMVYNIRCLNEVEILTSERTATELVTCV